MSTVPDAPTLSSISPGNAQLLLTFSAPDYNGGSVITSYTYEINGTLVSGEISSDVSEYTITGLTNGTEYTVSLYAVNEVGSSSSSDSISATPYTVPDTPVITSITSGNLSLIVDVSASSFNGGRSITDYKYSIDSAGETYTSFDSSSTTLTIPGLAVSTTYTVRVKAVNIAGDSSASDSATGTAYTSADAPAMTQLVAGNGTITVYFTAGENNGSAITGYVVSANPLSVAESDWEFATIGQTDSPYTITGLTNGTKYAVQLKAVNAAGNSEGSNILYSTPYTVPDAPTITHVLAKNWTVSVDFDIGSNGGQSLTKMGYSLNGGSYVYTSTTTSPLTVGNLHNYNTYTIQLVATNDSGDSSESEEITFTPYYAMLELPWIKRKNTGNNTLTKRQQYALNVAVDKGKTRILKR
jgi:titin